MGFGQATPDHTTWSRGNQTLPIRVSTRAANEDKALIVDSTGLAMENTFYRYKRIIGVALRARILASQERESKVGCSILNRMARLGMPVSERIL